MMITILQYNKFPDRFRISLFLYKNKSCATLC